MRYGEVMDIDNLKKDDAVTTMRSVAGGFSYVMDMVNAEVEDHHKKVAYLAYRLAEEMQMPEHACRLSIIGGLLHDIGGVLEQGKISLMDLEANAIKLADAGANIVSLIPVDAPLAEIVKYSQRPADDLIEMTKDYDNVRDWLKEQQKLEEPEKRKQISRMIGQIVHLADVAVLLFDGDSSPLNQVKRVRAGIRIIAGLDQPGDPFSTVHADLNAEMCEKMKAVQEENAGTDAVSCDCSHCTHFHPWTLEAFCSMCKKEAIWLDLAYEPEAFLQFIPDDAAVTLETMAMLSEFASVIIDFRSPFTAMHSAGVSASAVELAKLLGMTEEQCMMMKIAGNLHDIGKLKTPKEILEKPGKLTDEEFNIIKEHPYFTWKILSHIEGLTVIMNWASYHHEKLNGRGYPFHYDADKICLGARVLAVADIFSAITEDRPYRKGMEKEKALEILKGDAERGDIDASIVELLAANYDQVNEARAKASRAAGRRYYEVR